MSEYTGVASIDKFLLKVTVNGTETLANTNVNWSIVSGNATISKDGYLTPTGIGDVQIKAISKDRNIAVSSALTIKIYGCTKVFTITGITNPMVVGINDTALVSAGKATWSTTASTNNLFIDATSGYIIAQNAGTYQIKAKMNDECGTEVTQNVIVSPTVSSISFTGLYWLYQGYSTTYLVSIFPASAPRGVIWSVNNTKELSKLIN